MADTSRTFHRNALARALCWQCENIFSSKARENKKNEQQPAERQQQQQHRIYVYKNIIVTSVNINNDAKYTKYFMPNAYAAHHHSEWFSAISTISNAQSMWEH